MPLSYPIGRSLPNPIRAATAADVPAIVNIVDRAYRHYIARIGKPPAPMLDDYAARVSEDAVWVLQEKPAITGILVLLSAPEYLLLDNIATAPERQGRGRALEPVEELRGRIDLVVVLALGAVRQVNPA